MNFLETAVGANWRTTVSSLGTLLFGMVTFLATVSYDTSPLALIIPPAYKPKVQLVAGLATAFLWFWNGVAQKSKEVTGGTVKQNVDGSVLAKDARDLSNLPAFFSYIENGQLVKKPTAEASEDELEAIKRAVGQTTLRTESTSAR